MPNQEVFDQALQRIAVDPDSFDMGTFYYAGGCCTVACLAGHVALMRGWTMKVNPNGHAGRATKDGHILDIELVAQVALGLTDWQADYMFSPNAVEVDGYHEDSVPETAEELSMRWKAVTCSVK